jgi:hypothetical protein
MTARPPTSPRPIESVRVTILRNGTVWRQDRAGRIERLKDAPPLFDPTPAPVVAPAQPVLADLDFA